MHLQPGFALADDTMTLKTADGWLLAPPPYSHYFTPMAQIPQQKGLAKGGTRSVLKKRRTFTDSPRLRPLKEQPRSRPSTYIEPSPPPPPTTTQTPFPQSASASKHSVLLPGLRPDSLWLNRPTQPLRIRKSSQSPQTPPPPWWNGSGTSQVVSNSPILPIGGKIPSRPAAPRTVKSSPSLIAKTAPTAANASASASAAMSTSTLLPSPIHSGLETLLASVESDFKHVRRPSRSISVATSLSVYSQASASYSLIPEAQEFDRDLGAGRKDEKASETYSAPSAEMGQAMTSHDLTYFNADSRLSVSTSTHASDATSSTLSTLVDPSTPRKDKKHLECTRLSLQPCPSLASAHRILSLSDLPPNHDAPSPIDENTYRRYEHEGKFDSPFNDPDICADYDYIHAIDVLIYGVRPLPDVPVDVARRPSRSRPRRDNTIRHSGSDKGRPQVSKRNAHNTPPVSFNRTPRKNSFKVCPKGAVKMEARQEEHKGERRSILFKVTHFFGKSSSP